MHTETPVRDATPTIPNGYWTDPQGRLVPQELIKPIDQERNHLVLQLVAQARKLSELLAAFKGQAFADVDAFVDLSAEQYGVKLGGRKGNVSLMSFDGRYKVLRQIQDTLVFDERLQAAKALIDQCVKRWTQDSRAEVRALIDNAFQVDKEGNISTSRVLGLRRLSIDDEEWQRAMRAIGDSVQTAASTAYLRVYERIEDSDQFRPIPLDIASVRTV